MKSSYQISANKYNVLKSLIMFPRRTFLILLSDVCLVHRTPQKRLKEFKPNFAQ